MTPQDFINGEERSIKRNPLLAQLLYYTKDIESFGTGLKRIVLACEEAGVVVEFKLLKKGFAVVFYRPDDQFYTTTKRTDVLLNVSLNVLLNEMEKKTLFIINENPTATADQIAGTLSKSRKSAQRYLSGLRKKNAIRRVGSKKDGHWELVENGKEDNSD